MSLLFLTFFDDHPLHVFQVRGRTAFLVQELGAAAGHGDNGHALVALLSRDWAPDFEEDDDLTWLSPVELKALNREIELPAGTGSVLVMFTAGVEKALRRSETRFATSLLKHLGDEVYPRVALGETPEGDSDPDAGPAAPPPTEPSVDLDEDSIEEEFAFELLGFQRRKTEYHAIRRYAGLLWAYGRTDTAGWLRLERQAVEALIGRRLQTPPRRTPAAANQASAEPAAAAA